MGCKEAIRSLANIPKSIIPDDGGEESKEIGVNKVIKGLHGGGSIDSPILKLFPSTHSNDIGFIQVHLEYKGDIWGAIANKK